MEKTNHLSTFGIAKSAIGIPLKSYNFVILTFLACLPLFFVELLPTLSFYLSETPSFSKQLPFNPNKLIYTITLLVPSDTIVLLCYLFCHYVKFLVANTTISSASLLYNTGRSMSLRNLLQHAITRTKWSSTFGTFLIMSGLSDISLEIALYWFEKGPLVSSRNIFLNVVHGLVFALAMIKWWEYSLLWNLGFVISCFEEKFGFKAFSVSADLTKGNRIRGMSLMLVYGVWRLLVLPFFFPREISSGKIVNGVLNASFLCVWSVFASLFFVVYYHDCKIRYKEKMKVEEGGKSE